MNTNHNNSVKIQFIITMLVFGTIGTLSRFINMPSSIICVGRAFVGAIVILLILAIKKQPLDKEAIRRNIGWLTLSSFLMCFNWICQFEAFKYTSIATATLCYYMQPIFFIILARIILKESVSPKKWGCVLVAFVGMFLVSGVASVGFDLSELKGAIFGITGGLFYALVVLINKYMKDISPVNTTVMQFALVTIIMIPYTFITDAYGAIAFSTRGLICLIVLGVIHSGVAYIFYFDAVNKLPATTVGILSYIDPVEAILLSALLLREPLSISTIIGAMLILGATAVSEKN